MSNLTKSSIFSFFIALVLLCTSQRLYSDQVAGAGITGGSQVCTQEMAEESLSVIGAVQAVNHCFFDAARVIETAQVTESVALDRSSMGCASAVLGVKAILVRANSNGLLNPELIRRLRVASHLTRQQTRPSWRRAAVIRRSQITRVEPRLRNSAIVRAPTRITRPVLAGAAAADQLLTARNLLAVGALTTVVTLSASAGSATTCPENSPIPLDTNADGTCRVDYDEASSVIEAIMNPDAAATYVARDSEFCTHLSDLAAHLYEEAVQSIPMLAEEVTMVGPAICNRSLSEYEYGLTINDPTGDYPSQNFFISRKEGRIRVRNPADDGGFSSMDINLSGDENSPITSIAVVDGLNAARTIRFADLIGSDQDVDRSLYLTARSIVNLNEKFFGPAAQACCRGTNIDVSLCSSLGIQGTPPPPDEPAGTVGQ